MAHKSLKKNKSKKGMKGMVETKSSHHPVGNESKNLTDENKGQSSTPK